MKLGAMRKGSWSYFFWGLVALVVLQGSYSLWPEQDARQDQVISVRADGSKVDPLDVMLVADLSGPTRGLGRELASGFRDAIARLNATNELRLVERDDAGKIEAASALAEGAAAGFRTLAMVGPSYGPNITALEAAANEGELAVLVPIAKPSTAINGPWTFTLQTSMFHQGEMLGKLIPMFAPPERIANFVSVGATPTGFWGGIIEAFRKDFSITLDQVYWPSGQTSDAQQALVRENLYYDLIIISLPLGETAEVVRNLKLLGFIGTIVVEGEASLWNFSKSFANERRETIAPGFFTNNIVGLVPFTPLVASSDSQRLISIYRQVHKVDPTWAYAYGYDAGILVSNFIIQARAAGRLDLTKPDKMREAFRTYLSGLKEQGLPGGGFTGDLSFNLSRERESPPRFIVYRGGRQEPLNLQIGEVPSIATSVATSGRHISVGDLSYSVVPVVETGIRIKDLAKLDMEQGLFDATFDFWFKSASAIKLEDITFLNQVGPLRSGVLVEEVQYGASVFRHYTVDGQFRYAPRPADSLLGRTSIDVLWRHSRLNSDALHFVAEADRGAAAFKNRGGEGKAGAASIREYSVAASYLAVSDESLPAFGDPRGVNGTLRYSVASYHVDLAKLQSTFTSRVISVFGFRKIHYALAIMGGVGLLLALYEIRRRRSDFVAIAQCCWIVVSLLLSEITFFTSPLTEEVRLTDLLLIEKSYAFLYIFVVVRLIDVLIFRSQSQRSGEGRTNPVMVFAARASLYFVGAAVFYTNILGRDILPVLATSSVLLTVVGLALRELIFDAMAGVALTTDKHIRVGEWISVRVRDRLTSGKVEGIGWRHTRIRSRDNQTHFIPNSAIATQVLSNLSVAGGYTRIECSFVVSARVNVGEMLPRIEQVLAQQFADSREFDQERPMKAMIERLEGECVYCVIQAFVSPDASVDQVKTRILETVRLVLLQDEAFAGGVYLASSLAGRSLRPAT